MKKYSIIILLVLLVKIGTAQSTVSIFSDPSCKPVTFATEDIKSALAKNGYLIQNNASLNAIPHNNNEGVSIVLSLISDTATQNIFIANGGLAVGIMGEQAYVIRRTGLKNNFTYWVFGADIAGVMYGGLRLSEAIHTGEFEKLESEQESPYIKRRGLKFNISLDSRIPSFSDNGTNAYLHREYVWDINFWKEWLDDLARYRYNFLSLWNRHPFPALIKLKDYPEVALNDVYSEDSLIKKMTIDEKIAFWQEVISYAKDRCIDITWFTWNIHIDHAKQYGIEESATDPETIAYMQECVKQLFRTYPNLHGIGITAGEQMREYKDNDIKKEEWLFNTYGKAMLDIASEQPERKFYFIHRYWQTQFEYITDNFKPLIDHPNIDFDLSFKYSRARMYSAPNPPFAKDEVLPTLPSSLRIWWNVRNDDILTFRWGDPDYVRSYIMNMPPENQTAGFHMGSDKYVWGRETMLRKSDNPRELQTKYNWYNFMLWGRMGYNPATPNELFVKILAAKFSDINAEAMFNAWRAASKTFPMATLFHWHSWAYMWHVETCSGYSSETGLKYTKAFYNVLDFIDNPTMPESGIMNISQYTNAFVGGDTLGMRTPFVHANEMKSFANSALAELAEVGSSNSEEARLIQEDIKAMAYAGLYYANKIEAATYFSLFQSTKDIGYQTKAIQHMQFAYSAWKVYIDIFRTYFDHGELSIINRRIDYDQLLKVVQHDIELVDGHSSGD